ncbi:hypothetical protein LguiB_018960 [Lonicera macranthoides]
MPESTTHNSSKSIWPIGFLISILAPVVVAVLIYQLDSFDPAPIPGLTQVTVFVPKRNSRMLQGSEKIGVQQLLAPEDIAYDPDSRVFYTGSIDGWVKRVTVADFVVENWVNTGGRPLGIALGRNRDVIGLFKVTSNGVVKLLTDEAEGLKFKLTNDVDVANDGMIYFSDASYKYGLKEFIFDFLEGRPFGRLLSYDPSTKHTTVLVRNLYFANGVAISPDQKFVVFCETPMYVIPCNFVFGYKVIFALNKLNNSRTRRSCKKYYIKGERKGSVDIFIDNLPGFPDNLRYDGEGHYWIALATEYSYQWYVAQKYPFIRKVIAIMEKYVGRPPMEKNGGSIAVDLEGKPIAHYHDPGNAIISSTVKIDDHLYCGSIVNPYIIRLNLTRYPAVTSA